MNSVKRVSIPKLDLSKLNESDSDEENLSAVKGIPKIIKPKKLFKPAEKKQKSSLKPLRRVAAERISLNQRYLSYSLRDISRDQWNTSPEPEVEEDIPRLKMKRLRGVIRKKSRSNGRRNRIKNSLPAPNLRLEKRNRKRRKKKKKQFVFQSLNLDLERERNFLRVEPSEKCRSAGSSPLFKKTNPDFEDDRPSPNIEPIKGKIVKNFDFDMLDLDADTVKEP